MSSKDTIAFLQKDRLTEAEKKIWSEVFVKELYRWVEREHGEPEEYVGYAGETADDVIYNLRSCQLTARAGDFRDQICGK